MARFLIKNRADGKAGVAPFAGKTEKAAGLIAFGGGERQPQRFQGLFIIDGCRGTSEFREAFFKGNAGNGFKSGGDRSKSFAAVLFAGHTVLRPEAAHDVVQRLFAFGVVTQFGVKGERGERSLFVIGHRRIGRVGVGFVELHPSIETGFAQGLNGTGMGFENRLEVHREKFCVPLVVNESRATQHQVVVITCEAFEEP